MDKDLLEALRRRTWFYDFELPDGSLLESALEPEAQPVHTTRRVMLDGVLEREFGGNLNGVEAIDLACHQGYFSCQLADKGARVLGIDAREAHVEDTQLISKALDLGGRIRVQQADVHDLDAGKTGRFDLVLMFGLLYHLENPIGALRLARALTKRLCVIETQIGPGLSGPLDWGHYKFVKTMQGAFAVIDETEETHGKEASVTGICLVPSLDGLLWCLKKVGFQRTEVIAPPQDAYEQHRFGKRVMVAAWA